MKLRSKLLTLVLITSVLLPNTARSNEDACTPVVQACDKALADQDKVIELGRKVQATQSDLINMQDKQIKDLSDNGKSILSNPVLYLFIGAVVGGYLVGRTK